MTEKKLDLWWASLQTAQKSRIASKAAQHASGDPDALVPYPECTTWWLSLDPAPKQAIYEHCTVVHGLLLPELREGTTFSY